MKHATDVNNAMHEQVETNQEEAEHGEATQQQEQQEPETDNQHGTQNAISHNTGIAQEEEQHEEDADIKHATDVNDAMHEQEETNQEEAEHSGATQQQEQQEQDTGNQHGTQNAMPRDGMDAKEAVSEPSASNISAPGGKRKPLTVSSQSQHPFETRSECVEE